MKRSSLTSLAALALGWQVVSAADPVYSLPQAASTPAATGASEFGANYMPITPVRSTMPPAPTATVPTESGAQKSMPTTMPQVATAVPSTEVVPAGASESTPAPSPLQSSASPLQGSTPPATLPAMPAAAVTPASAPTTLPAAPAALPAPASTPATLPPAGTATPLPALMPPVKNTAPATSTPATTKPTTTTVTTPVSKPAATVNKPATPATLAPAATPHTMHRTNSAPTVRSQLREFLGIVDVEEQEQPAGKSAPAMKKEVGGEHADVAAHGASCSSGCCTKGSCGRNFCFGCWCEEHLSHLRGRLHDCCCGGGADGDIIAGVTFYWVQPNFESNPAFFSGTNNAAARSDYRYHLEFAPQIWLGYVGNDGLGGRITWWQFDHASSTEAIAATGATEVALVGFIPLSPGDTLVTGSNLALNVWDFEITQDLRLHHWVLLASGGLRYAHMSQDFFASVNAQGLAPGGDVTIVGGHNFNGAGPTVALAARRLLGDSGLALFGMTRSAVLFGSGNAGTFIAGGPALTIESAQADVLPVVELELGAEYGRAVGDYRLFGQIGFVGSCWFGAGNAQGNTLGGLLGLDSGETSNLGFTGFFVRAGIGY